MIFLGGRGQGYVSLKTTELVYPNGTVTPGPTLPNTVWDHETVALHDGRFMIIGKTFFTSNALGGVVHNRQSHVLTKGQLISKCCFVVFKSPKNPSKKFPGFLPYTVNNYSRL